MIALSIARLDSPVGPLLIAADGEGRLRRGALRSAVRPDGPAGARLRRVGRRPQPRTPIRPAAVSALRAYFGGALDAIDTLPAAPTGTPFQQEVWQWLRTIPSGTTTSYGVIARAARTARCLARGGARQWRQSRGHRDSLPSCRGEHGRPHRLRGRAGPQALAARARSETRSSGDCSDACRIVGPAYAVPASARAASNGRSRSGSSLSSANSRPQRRTNSTSSRAPCRRTIPVMSTRSCGRAATSL